VSTWVGKYSSVVHVLAVTIINLLTISLGGNPQLLSCLSVLLSEGPAFVTHFSEVLIKKLWYGVSNNKHVQ